MAKTKIGFIDPNEGILITAKEYVKGDKGDPGKDGKDGYTPIKGVDYFDGKPGPQGPAGKDGTMSFEELTEEQKASLKGDPGPAGPQGEPGPAGNDYVLTDTDKAEIAQLALAAMPAAEEGAY